MRTLEVTCWVPRALDVGPVRVETGSGVCEVTLATAKGTSAYASLDGCDVNVRIDEPDDLLPDDHLFARAREVTLLAVNQLVQVARFVSTRPVHVVPVLDERDFANLLVFVLGQPAARPLVTAVVAPRSLRIARTLVLSEVSAHLAPLARLDDADHLWRAALEAACVGRAADAVIGARAALESAWVATVEAAVAEHRRAATTDLLRVLNAHHDAATDGRTGIRLRLEAYSEALLGESFATRWSDPLWGQVCATFNARNLAAHGAGAVTLDDAFRVVKHIKQALDDMVKVRARYP